MNKERFECMLSGHIWDAIICHYSQCKRCSAIQRYFVIGIDFDGEIIYDNVIYNPGSATFDYHNCKMIKMKEAQIKEVKLNRKIQRFQKFPIQKRLNKLMSYINDNSTQLHK